MPDKVIVSNRSALVAKYGSAGAAKINTALRKLVAADKARGLTSRLVFLDDAGAMARLDAPVVKRASSERQNKAAIDAVFAKLAPDYLMILGSVDVIPHQSLANPVFDPADPEADVDETVPSDLPYACEAPSSTRIEDFIAPSRVVGRLPDVTGADDPAYLLALLAHAAKPVLTPSTSISAFGVTARVWRRSTSKSMRALFGAGTKSRTSPKLGPKWTDDELSHRFHFINCHGDKRSPQFFGEVDDGKPEHTDPADFPVAHDAVVITKRIQAGTVAAAECCYGAELYDPRRQGQISIGNTYLECGSLAYFGSTTIAYGPATTNNYADVICRLFLEEVMKGRSTGDATLTARLKYAKVSKPIDAVDLKTLAQFILLGDPSLHPVKRATKRVPSRAGARKLRAGATRAKAMPAPFDASAAARAERRGESRTQAAVLEATAPVACERVAASADVVATIASRAAEAGIANASVMSFATRLGTRNAAAVGGGGAGPVMAVRRAERTLAGAPRSDVRVHVAIGRARGADGRRPRHPIAIVAQERDGQVIRLEKIYGKAERAGARGQGRQASRRRPVEERPSRGHARE
jgi:hypothetical protein